MRVCCRSAPRIWLWWCRWLCWLLVMVMVVAGMDWLGSVRFGTYLLVKPAFALHEKCPDFEYTPHPDAMRCDGCQTCNHPRGRGRTIDLEVRSCATHEKATKAKCQGLALQHRQCFTIATCIPVLYVRSLNEHVVARSCSCMGPGTIIQQAKSQPLQYRA
ncbi:hypothetical protein F4808DRAFT_439253 [Astrocystis sublimbata]|nr:hypothetical protein F4808DRAFT_439253 [Astrocystis sublimbata]